MGACRVLFGLGPLLARIETISSASRCRCLQYRDAGLSCRSSKMCAACGQFFGRMPGRLWRPGRLLRREPIVLEALNQDRRNGLIRASQRRERASDGR